jgi:hypothetical protein
MTNTRRPPQDARNRPDTVATEENERLQTSSFAEALLAMPQDDGSFENPLREADVDPIVTLP